MQTKVESTSARSALWALVLAIAISPWPVQAGHGLEGAQSQRRAIPQHPIPQHPVQAVAGPDFEEGEEDAGSLPMVAIPVTGTGPLGRISGALGGTALAPRNDFEDMYLIQIVDPLGFSAVTQSTFNIQLWLFNAEGFGLAANNDTDLAERISTEAKLIGGPGTLTGPGKYLLAVSGGSTPANGCGAMFVLDKTTEQSTADGPGGLLPIFNWNGPSESGLYSIELSGAAFITPPEVDLPLMSSWGMRTLVLVLLAGIIGVLIRRSCSSGLRTS